MKNCILIVLVIVLSIQTKSQTAESAYKAGMLLKGAKKTVNAITEFEKALRLDPKSYKSMYELGWCYNDTKQYQLALNYLKKVRVEWPTISKVFFEIGFAFENLNFTDSAKVSYNKCLELKPDYKMAYKQLAKIEYVAENYKESLAMVNKYLALDTTGGNDYLVWYRKGFSENAIKKYNDAILSLQKSLKLKKDYLNTFLELGFAHTKLKQGAQAINSFTQANKLDAKSHIPYNGIAEVYRDVYKKLDSAMYWYNETLKVKPKERKANFGIGYCLNAQGKYTEAESYLKTAIEQEATYAAAYVELGFAYLMLKRYSSSEQNLKKAIQLSPENHNAHYYLCKLYIEQRNKPAASKILDELQKLNSKYTEDLKKLVQKL